MANPKRKAKHVVAHMDAPSDAGSIPAASTISGLALYTDYNKKAAAQRADAWNASNSPRNLPRKDVRETDS